MKFTKAKLSDLALPGVTIETDQVDDHLKCISFSVDGKLAFRIAHDTYANGIKVEVLAPPPTKDVWRLSGTVLGIPLTQDFDDQYKANDEKRRFEARCEEDGCKLTVEKTTVEINEKEEADVKF